MGWNNNGYGRQNNYQNNGGFDMSQMQQMFNQFMQNGGQKFKKKSGAKEVMGKDGQTYITAWNASKDRGLITAFVFPYHKTKEYKNKKGQTGVTLMVKVTFKRTGQEILKPVTMNQTTGKIVIQDLGMVINPKAPNGGYFGTFTKRK